MWVVVGGVVFVCLAYDGVSWWSQDAKLAQAYCQVSTFQNEK